MTGSREIQSSRATGIGVVAILLWAALALLTVKAGLIPPFELLSLCFSVAFLAWDFATKHGNLPVLGALSYLAPVVSTVLLTVAGTVPASASLFVSAFLVIAGALVATGSNR